jgi:hypothetical protein
MPSRSPFDSLATRRRVRKRNGRSSSHPSCGQTSVAERSRSAAMARFLSTSSGSPSARRSAAPASVKAVNETTRPATIAYGLSRFVLATLPATRIGSTGRMHGEIAVTTPARKAMPSSTTILVPRIGGPSLPQG